MDDNILKLIDEHFGETSLKNWKRKLDEGTVPSLEQLANLIEANFSQPMPPWLVIHLCDRLRKPDRPKRGRPRSGKSDVVTVAFAKLLYQFWLTKFQKERPTHLARRKNTTSPPHELAAQTVQKLVYPDKDWKAVLNLLSSQK